ncbi:hypothetical protein QOZ80_8AG0621320 [Eleusine coracana subsp. coracana]|nr:hypothetical protein QOZ80_8AG0621320 [Eleusine coracana subsp. coracana]
MWCSNNRRAFHRKISLKIWQVNALLITEVVLAGVILGIGSYGQRYRRRSFTRFIFLGATTVFLPIISYVVSTISANSTIYMPYSDEDNLGLVARCHCEAHSIMVVASSFLVQITMVDTSVAVAVDDREGQNLGPPWELLVQGVWTFYLGISSLERVDTLGLVMEFMPCVLMMVKVLLKCYAFLKARQSIALGQNPRLIFAYMQQPQLEEASQHVESHADDGEVASPPPLLVVGEEGRHVEKQPCGYVFKDELGGPMIKNTGLVTIDKVWQMDMKPRIGTPRLNRNLCLSFALFKLLRCRFARYELTKSSSTGTLKFFWSLLMEDGEPDRIFGVITDEISFTNDYYYSSLPISYSKCWLPMFNMFTSLLNITYCTVIAIFLIMMGLPIGMQLHDPILCSISCIGTNFYNYSYEEEEYFGRWYFDASYICSNWTKVMLICRYVNNASCQHLLLVQKWVGLRLQYRRNLTKHCGQKMGQCSILVFQQRTTPLVLVRTLFLSPDQVRSVKIPAAVKVCIIDALRNSKNGGLTNGTASLLRNQQVGESFLWACNGKGTSDVILTWHIATAILKVRHPYVADEEQGSGSLPFSDYEITATQLS